jgi:hypothetical protein
MASDWRESDLDRAVGLVESDPDAEEFGEAVEELTKRWPTISTRRSEPSSTRRGKMWTNPRGSVSVRRFWMKGSVDWTRTAEASRTCAGW